MNYNKVIVLIISFFSVITSMSVQAQLGNTNMRCKGMLITNGMQLSEVRKFCGRPLAESEDSHLFVDHNEVKQIKYNYLTYKESALVKHYMLFKDGRLVKSANQAIPESIREAS